jgi:hypothetical protein
MLSCEQCIRLGPRAPWLTVPADIGSTVGQDHKQRRITLTSHRIGHRATNIQTSRQWRPTTAWKPRQ